MAKAERRVKRRVGGAQPKTTRTMQLLFLRELERTGSVRLASEKTGLDRKTWRTLAIEDPYFNQEWQEALAGFQDTLEYEATRRGRDGYEKPVYWRGHVIGTVREYSDALLQTRLAAELPDKYKKIKEHRGSTEHPLVLEHRYGKSE